ncbi:MAG: hypothetical protein GX894_02935 [Clostridia bacterium]|nr:hypothetical protein [Clostridia bacterium]
MANAISGIPAITNPMQAVLASGTTPRFTGNHYRYYDKQLNRVVQEEPARKNEAETLAEAAVRQGVEAFSINQFAFLYRGTGWWGQEETYFNAPPGTNGYADYSARFDEAIRFLRAYAEKRNSGSLPERQAPFLLALYMDDLDAVGHNMKEVYGVSPVRTEAERRQAVVDRLALMDRKLAEFIEVCLETGLYEEMSFLLTTDHGMAPMGFGLATEPGFPDSAASKLPDLLARIEALGTGYKCEVLLPGGKERPDEGTDIAVVTVGLMVQLSYVNEFNPDVIQEKNTRIARALQNADYVGRIMFPGEMKVRGVKPGFADLLVSSQPPYHFRPYPTGLTRARGQHDSLAGEAQAIVAFMWGKNIKKGVTYTGRVEGADFAPTMAELLGINAPLDATGRVLYEVLEGIGRPQNCLVKREDQELTITGGTVHRLEDTMASGGTAMSLQEELSSVQLVEVPAARSMILEYAAGNDNWILLYHNGQFVRRVFLPATGGPGSGYEKKRINLTLAQGDTVGFVLEKTGDLRIDCVTFISPHVSQEEPVPPGNR